MTTHIVQAWNSLIGWVDCCKAESYVDATMEEHRLKTGNGWMPQTKTRRTRIVPVEDANCKYT